MLKKSVITVVLALTMASSIFTLGAHAAAVVKNGVACTKSGASTSVTVKGVKNTYICKINPTVAGASKPSWTLAKCLTNWALLKTQQDNINQALSIANLESDPGKTSDVNMLNGQQAALNKLIEANSTNWCKAGL
jgi:hypothetical protein